MATALSLEALGLTQEEAAERVIQKLADSYLYEEASDEDGYTHRVHSSFSREIDKTIQQKIDEAVSTMAEAEIGPRIAALVDGATLQQTNQWGERRGEALTFREYLVQRAEAYMVEPLSYDGKPKGADSYSWSAKTTRVAYMIDKHLHYQIESAMKQALSELNSNVAKGLHEAVRIAINETVGKLKVSVKAS